MPLPKSRWTGFGSEQPECVARKRLQKNQSHINIGVKSPFVKVLEILKNFFQEVFKQGLGQRPKVFPPRKGVHMAQKRNHLMRYILLAVLFCAVCLVYVGRLFYVQIIAREETKEDGTSVRLVIVPAVRGEIFDRNGKALVANRYTYDLVLSNAVLTGVSASEMNRVCLSLLNALATCDAESTHTEKYFPFVGSYPNYSYSADSQNANSSVSFHLKRILKAHGMKATTAAKNLVSELVDTYRLRETDGAGNRVYTDRQIDRLLRLHLSLIHI